MRIRDLANSGSGIEKSGRDKHPGSATLVHYMRKISFNKIEDNKKIFNNSAEITKYFPN
jgi:hypothetical protein